MYDPIPDRYLSVDALHGTSSWCACHSCAFFSSLSVLPWCEITKLHVHVVGVTNGCALRMTSSLTARVDTAMEPEGQRHSSYNQHAVSASEGSSDEDGEEMENDLEDAVTNSTFNDRQVQ